MSYLTFEGRISEKMEVIDGNVSSAYVRVVLKLKQSQNTLLFFFFLQNNQLHYALFCKTVDDSLANLVCPSAKVTAENYCTVPHWLWSYDYYHCMAGKANTWPLCSHLYA